MLGAYRAWPDQQGQVARGVILLGRDQMNVWSRIEPAPGKGSVVPSWCARTDVRCGGGAHLVCERPESWNCFWSAKEEQDRPPQQGAAILSERPRSGDSPSRKWGGARPKCLATTGPPPRNTTPPSSLPADLRSAPLLTRESGRYVPHKAILPLRQSRHPLNSKAPPL